ncbi:MAG TPA: hypothetical protein PKB10_14765 [Tepidisphaeraceae bacterium]|nr:hypothetical protein [Tepidisphaeraceae bacterium]
MTPNRPVVLVTEGSDPRPLDWLKERATVIEKRVEDPDFFDALSRAEGMVVRTYTRVNADLLSRAPKLRVVGRGGGGLEDIHGPPPRPRRGGGVSTPPRRSWRSWLKAGWGWKTSTSPPAAPAASRSSTPPMPTRSRSAISSPGSSCNCFARGRCSGIAR